jgi:hypothetical protein
VYHVELREFPHNTHAFNLDAARLQEKILGPWIRDQVFELGERSWIPQRTTITILEGPELPIHRLGLGRGWTNALREGTDVTSDVLAAAQASDYTPNPAASLPDPRNRRKREPEIERDILARCAVGPLSLGAVWDRAEVAAPDASAGERLVLAEVALTRLLGEGRVELCRGNKPSANAIAPEETGAVLSAREAWGSERPTGVFVRTTES